MKFADSITKGFLRYAQPKMGKEGSSILNYQDPTYLGFQWRILNTQDFTRATGAPDMDYYPQGLFLPDADTDSAYSYFIRTNQYARADMIKEFRQGFLDLLKKAPWYFTKVSGLEEIWKIDPGNSYRGKDKKLTFTTEEAIDLKLTYLMDLYRKAVFDTGWMRYALPENQRMFAMELVVAEVRPMQLSLKGWVDANLYGVYPGVILNDVGGLFTAIGNFAGKIGDPDTSQLNINVSNNSAINDVASDVGDILIGGALSAAAGKLGLRAPWSTTTFLSFRFDMCTFDPFSNSPTYLADLGKTPEKKAENIVVVNTPYVSEMNSYGLLGAVIKDSYYASDYSRDIKNLSVQSRTISDTLGGGNFKSTIALALRRLTNKVLSKLGLENVYGFSAGSIAGAVGGFFNNPIATTREVLGNFVNRNAQAELVAENLGNVGLSSQDIELIVNEIGAVYQESQLLQSSLVDESIGKAVEDDVISNPNLVTSNLPKGVLTGANIVRRRLGNVYDGSILGQQ